MPVNEHYQNSFPAVKTSPGCKRLNKIVKKDHSTPYDKINLKNLTIKDEAK